MTMPTATPSTVLTEGRVVAVLVCLAALLGSLLVLPGASALPTVSEEVPSIAVGQLTTNGRVDPLGIPGQPPVFGWVSSSSRRAVRQTAYELQVGPSEGGAEVWRTGRVASSRQVGVVYEGAQLAAGTRYFWRVRVWDDQGTVSAWSAPAWFETGLLSVGDWGGAQWVGRPSPSYEHWTDYTATLRFKLNSTAFGTFLRARDVNNAYMWQINVSTGVPMLRPHRRVNGGYALLGEVDLRRFDFTAQGLLSGEHEVSFRSTGNTIETSLDGKVVDSRTVTNFNRGRVGVRTFGAESVTVSSLSVTKPDGTVLARPDFGTNPFNGGTFAHGQVTVSGTADVLLNGPEEYMPLLRKEFTTEAGKAVESARLYASSHGVYELSLNGEKVGDQFLAPGYTEYAKRIQSQTYDVTGLVSDGVNGFGAALGDGWWAGKIGLEGKGQYGRDLALVARLKVTYTDGTVQWIDTDSTWRWAPGPFVATDNQLGETYSAAQEQSGWNTADFDDTSWSPVVVRASATAKLSPQPDEPVRETDLLGTVKVTEPSPGVKIYDLGQNMVGVPRVTVTGTAGETVRLRHAEVLNRDGTMYTANLRAALATDYYTFAKDGTVTYQPTFTQHGFRYIELTGLSQAPTAADVKGVVLGSDLPRTGYLETSDAMLNQLHSNVTWGARGNFLSIPTDTPARDERLGWTGDISIFAPTANYLSDTRGFLGKWMTDVRDEQKANGGVPAVVPSTNGAFDMSAVGWEDAIITVPHAVWNATGDATIVRDNYEAMSKFFAYARASAGADNLETGRLSFFTNDWLHLDDPTNQGVLGTAIWAQDVKMMSEMAAAIGRDTEAAEYADLYEAVRRSFTNAYVASDGTVLGNSQTGYALALGEGLIIDPQLESKAGERFVAKLAKTDYHLRTGFIGTPWLLPALSNIARDDLAYTMLQHKDYPSWGYEIENGATTIWERWNSIMPDGSFGPVDMNSFNHYAYGAVADWMHQHIGGLSILEPGYKRSKIAPTIGGGLTEGTGTLDTVYGELANAWAKTKDGVTMEVTVPVNTTAEIHVPAASRWAVTEGGQPAIDAPDVRFLRMEDGAAVFEVGSGAYSFAVDAVLGGLGQGSDLAHELRDLVDGLDTPDVPATRIWAREVITAVENAWSAYLGNDDADAVAKVHRALARLGDIRRWSDSQAAKQRLDDDDAAAVNQLVEKIEAKLSTVSGRLLGAVATIELPAEESFPGTTIPVTISIENVGSAALRSLSSTLTSTEGWLVEAASTNPTSAGPGQTARLRYEVQVPVDAALRRSVLEGQVSYAYQASTAKLPVSATVDLAAPVRVDAVTISPSMVAPGDVATVAVKLTNRTSRALRRHVELEPPAGWEKPSPTAYEIGAGATITVLLEAEVPLTVTEEKVSIVAKTGDLPAERGSADVMVELVTPPADAVDHVDLGDTASETSHGLTASPSSGTNTEAGLTRRYTNNSLSDGWFEMDLTVPAGQAFVIRAIETYNLAQLKTYDVTLDGQPALGRRYQRTAGGVGTATYQFEVQPSTATADGKVRIRFQDVPGDFDPSIADVWVVPAG